MRKLLTAAAIALALLAYHTEVQAQCSTNTITLPNGTVRVCMTCCMGTSCTTTCS